MLLAMLLVISSIIGLYIFFKLRNKRLRRLFVNQTTRKYVKDLIEGTKHELIHRKIDSLFGLHSKICVDVYYEIIDGQEIGPFNFFHTIPKEREIGSFKYICVEIIHFIYDILYDCFFFTLKNIPFKVYMFIRYIFDKSEVYWAFHDIDDPQFECIYRYEVLDDNIMIGYSPKEMDLNPLK